MKKQQTTKKMMKNKTIFISYILKWNFYLFVKNCIQNEITLENDHDPVDAPSE